MFSAFASAISQALHPLVMGGTAETFRKEYNQAQRSWHVYHFLAVNHYPRTPSGVPALPLTLMRSLDRRWPL